jgi:hypothetical protein
MSFGSMSSLCSSRRRRLSSFSSTASRSRRLSTSSSTGRSKSRSASLGPPPEVEVILLG